MGETNMAREKIADKGAKMRRIPNAKAGELAIRMRSDDHAWMFLSAICCQTPPRYVILLRPYYGPTAVVLQSYCGPTAALLRSYPCFTLQKAAIHPRKRAENVNDEIEKKNSAAHADQEQAVPSARNHPAVGSRVAPGFALGSFRFALSSS